MANLLVGFCDGQKYAIVNGHRAREQRSCLRRQRDMTAVCAYCRTRGLCRVSRAIARLKRDTRCFWCAAGCSDAGIADENLPESAVARARRLLMRCVAGGYG